MFNHLTNTHKGMLLALFGYTAFSFSDTCVKWLSEQGYSIYQIIVMDTAIGALLMLLFAPMLGGLASLRDGRNSKIHGLRVILNTGVNFSIVYCYSIMPLATVYTAIFTLPFIAAIIAMPLYGERIGIHRWVSIVIGFSGVLIAFQPWQDGTNLLLMALPLGTTTLIALMFLVARSLKGSSLLAMGFYPVFGSCLITIPFAISGFIPIELSHLHAFVLSGILMASGIICVSLAFQIADSAAVTPIVYTELIWAVLFGALLFGDYPHVWMLVGAAVIIVSGLYLLRAERRRPVILKDL
ncbi:MAG: DMT family transporter [Alphaproteobacteria bacterium]|nr:DMT family transporter [Alphaproteobacteria bacterium]